MSGALYMLRLDPDLGAIGLWAHEQGMAHAGGDLGYALHSLLTAAFDELAPQPFRLMETRTRAGHSVRLYAYSKVEPKQLSDHAAAFADPLVHRALDLEHFAAKPMPQSWKPGDIVRFEVRVRPVIREKAGTRRERDAFLWACDRAPDEKVDRARVYAEWLEERLTRGGLRVLTDEWIGNNERRIWMKSFRRTRVARRDAGRKLREVEGPDAVMSGRGEITDSEAFNELLGHGVGRHRAFGFGMLLLSPARE